MADSSFLAALIAARSRGLAGAFRTPIQARQAAECIDSALNSTGIVPIGAIVAWVSHLTGTPTNQVDTVLNTFTGKPFHVCDGSVVADAKSPINGQTLPSLNSAATDPIFLGGYTASSATLVASNMPTHVHDLGAHTHTEHVWTANVGSSAGLVTNATGSGAQVNIGTLTTGTAVGNTLGPSAGTDGTANDFPHHQKVIWIIRIR